MTQDFSTDWTSVHFPVWRKVLAPLRESPVAALEVGSWEGRSALFFLDQLPKCHLTCVDAFEVRPDKADRPGFAEQIRLAEERFDRNIAPFSERVEKIRETSAIALAALLIAGRTFDLVYIDGSHQTDDVLIDTALAWPMLRNNGVLIWDDYRTESVRAAVDAFVSLRQDRLEVVQRGKQMIIQRRPPPVLASHGGSPTIRRLLRLLRVGRTRVRPTA